MLGNFFGGRVLGSSQSTTEVPVATAHFFVGRENLINAFCRFPNAGNGQRLRVFAVHGAPGIGKSALLTQFRACLSELAPECAQTTFNFAALRDTTQAWRETLCALRADLGQNGMHFPRFDLLIGFSLAGEGGDRVLQPLLCPPLQDAARLAANALEVYQNNASELSDFAAQALQNGNEIFPHLERGIISDDLTAFVEKIAHLCRRDMVGDAGLPSDVVEAFALDFIDSLPPATVVYPAAEEIGEGAIRGALFFDGYEQMWNDRHAGTLSNERQLDWWMRDLCAYCLTSGVLPIIVGREKLLWAEDDADWTADDLEQHTLGRLSFTEARQFLAECEIGTAAGDGESEFSSAFGSGWADTLLPSYNSANDDLLPAPEVELNPLQAAILRCCAAEDSLLQVDPQNPEKTASGCHPFWLSLCATIVLQTRASGKREPNLTLFARSAAEQLEDRLCDAYFRALGNRAYERCLVDLSLTPRFDEAALRIQALEFGQSGEALNWETWTNSFFLQYETGANALPYLRIHPLLRRALQARLKHEESIEEHLKMLHYWAERGENELSWFHQWSIDPAAALARWRADHRAALEEGDIPKARAQFALWREIALAGNDHQKLGDPLWARTHATLARALLDTPFASAPTALCLAIDHLQNAHHGYLGSEYSAQRTDVQNLLKQVRHQLLLADAETAMRIGNLERARDDYLQALTYFTPENFPATWRQIQTNLALTYRELPDDAATLSMLEMRRDTETNAMRAIKHFEKSLQMLSHQQNPELWGQTQRSLALLYQASPAGTKLANARKAIVHFKESLKFFTPETYLEIWGQTQRELADCYMELRGEERVSTLQQAIAYYDAALQHFDGEQFPLEHAQLLHDVGLAWGELGYENDDLKAYEVAHSAFEAARTDFQVLGLAEEAAKAHEVAQEIFGKLKHLRGE